MTCTATIRVTAAALLSLGACILAFTTLAWMGDTAQAATRGDSLATGSGRLGSQSITVTKHCTSEIDAGGVLTYEIAVDTDAAVASTVVTDAVPALTQYVPGTITGTPAASVTVVPGNPLEWQIANLAAADRVTLTFAVTVTTPVTDGAIFTNTVWRDGAEVDRCAVTIRSPRLEIRKAAPVTATVGSSVVFTILYSNTGRAAAKGLVISDVLPSGLTLVAAEPPPTSNIGSLLTWQDDKPLLSNEHRSIVVTTTAMMTGVVTNSVHVGAAGGYTASASVAVTVARADVYLPVVLRSPPTVTLYVTSRNTGGINPFEVLPLSGARL
jgi:uncharacterized repeat protein (TIGR01451 family)